MKASCSPSEINPLFLSLVYNKAEYDALDFENYIPKSSTNRKKRDSISSPSTSKPMIVIIFKSVGFIEVDGKMEPLMEVAQSSKKLNIRVILNGTL